MRFHSFSLKTFILIIAINLSFSSFANNTSTIKSQFNVAYKAYQKAVKSNDLPLQMKYAKQSYQLGKELYGELHINTANLAVNLAALFKNNYRLKAKEYELLLKALNIYKNTYDKNSLDLVDLYLSLGHSATHKKGKNKESAKYFSKVLSIGKEYTKTRPMVNAQIQLEAGMGLLSIGNKKSRVLLKAQEYFSQHLKANDSRVVQANFYVGKYYLSRKKYSKAIVNFNLNLPVFEALEGPSHPLELSTHAFLINALEHKGKSDEATKHCIAIGSMQPWSNNQEQTPLFRIHPKYPINLARRGQSGFVILEVTISDFGTVTNSKILESKGGKDFERSSLEAVKKWRYAPKFENGKPIEATSTIQLDFLIN